MKYTFSMETVQQNGRFTLFSSKFLSIYSILYGFTTSGSKDIEVKIFDFVPKTQFLSLKDLNMLLLGFFTIFFLMLMAPPNFVTFYVQSQLPDWLDTAWKSLFYVIFKDSSSKILLYAVFKQWYSSLMALHFC